jgi:hypothetical protein
LSEVYVLIELMVVPKRKLRRSTVGSLSFCFMVGHAVKQVHSIVFCFSNAVVFTALSFGYFIIDGENGAGKPMSQIAAESHGARYIVVKLELFLGQKNVKVEIDVRVLVFAVDVKYFVVKVVDELHILLSRTWHPDGAT